MALQTLVKVGQVNNLSDARYCAGMGVEMIGFCLDRSKQEYVAPEKVSEMANWLSGIKLIGEYGGVDSLNSIDDHIKSLKLDYIQLNEIVPADVLSKISLPIIQRIEFSRENVDKIRKTMASYQPLVRYFLLDGNFTLAESKTLLQELTSQFPILISLREGAGVLDMMLSEIKPSGISLYGGNEIKPGLKDFEELAEVLEKLEVTDY